MPKSKAEIRQKWARRKPKALRYWLLDFVAVLLIGYLAFTASRLITEPSLMNIGLIIFFAYITLRLGYELIFKRGDLPVSASSFFECRKIAKVLQQEAALSNKGSFAVVDLGSGRGALTRCVARALPDAQIIGVEHSKSAYLQSVLLQRLFGLKNLSYINRNLFSYDCTLADAVVLYLGDGLTKQVGAKLHKELQRGAMVISNEFPLPAPWREENRFLFHTPFKAQILTYRQRDQPI